MVVCVLVLWNKTKQKTDQVEEMSVLLCCIIFFDITERRNKKGYI